jgi:acyl carrier protein
MTREDLEKKIFELISDKLGINEDEISIDSDFRKDLSADLLDISELMMNFEDEFSVIVPESDMVNLKTVGDVVNYVRQKLSL